MFGLCKLLTQPLRWVPPGVHQRNLSMLLNRVLAQPLADGELDFLRGKVVSIHVDDMTLRLSVACEDHGFARARRDSREDVIFSGASNAFLALASQREDADTLFFQRRLKIEGDTATALHLKNFLDAFGEPPLPGLAKRALQRANDFYEKFCRGDSDHSPQAIPGRPFQ